MREENLIYIEWLDSQVGNSRTWADISDYEAELPTHQSIGWVIEDKPTYYTIVPHIADETNTSLFQGTGIMSIPKCCITKTINITSLLPSPS